MWPSTEHNQPTMGIPLKKTKSSSFIINQLPIVPWLRVGLCGSFPPSMQEVLSSMSLHEYYSCYHNHNEFTHATALLCPENNFLGVTTPSRSYNPPVSFLLWFLSNERKGQDIDVPFQPEYSSLYYSPHLEQLWVCVNHNLLKTNNKKQSPKQNQTKQRTPLKKTI